ncbi:hypothetical protein_gp181 [Bacillus phage vB_BceM_WH1]|nr:hypothetical protein_gp181 [Bacillus phage vB_BceM_WH1]
MSNYQQLIGIVYVALFALFFMNAFVSLSKCHYYIQKGDDKSKTFRKCFASAGGWITLSLLNLIIAFYQFSHYIN